MRCAAIAALQINRGVCDDFFSICITVAICVLPNLAASLFGPVIDAYRFAIIGKFTKGGAMGALACPLQYFLQQEC
jgi:hypothetical protein